MIKHNRILTIFTIIIGLIICCGLLFYSGYFTSSHQIIYQENYNCSLLLLLIGSFWLFGFLCYKIFALENKIVKLDEAEENNKKLLESNKELLEYIVKQNEIDFINIQEFNYNTREMLLRAYYDNKSEE